MYVEELHNFLQQEQADVYLYYNHVHSPDYQTAYIIPSKERKRKIDSITDSLPERLLDDITGRYYNDLEYVDSVEIFKSFTSALDKSRHEDFSTVFPELNKIING